MNVERDRDEFDSAALKKQRESLPYLQMLNHPDPTQSGFFITLENAKAAHFTPTEEWVEHLAVFQNRQAAEGYRSLTARFLILRKSKLLMCDRESGEFIGDYQKSRYDRATMVLKTRYLIFLVDKDKRLLHESPLLFTTKGSFCGSFGEALKQFHSEMSKAYGAVTNAKKPRGDRFMALSVLAVRVTPILKGEKKKSWVCSVESHGVPTIENWRQFFVGYQPELKEHILAEFEDWAGFGNPDRQVSMSSRRSPQPAEPQPSNQPAEADLAGFADDDYGYQEL
ncbi:MAG: hypothetical protein HC771_24705 [Synechococcales cyanobacterium CRU_2_2]|nr:hypothetical protein [Synechococcales cyanobacterium CRU_2_2]